MKKLLPPVLLLLVAVTVYGGWFRGTEGQTTPYQLVVAGINSGKTIHLTMQTYEPNRSTEPLPRHALPESYTGELWVTYTNDLAPSECSITRDAQGAVLQRSVLEGSDLVTTFADGTSTSTPGLPYSRAKALRFVTTPGVSVSPGSVTSATAAQSGSHRFVNHYDQKTGELSGSETWDDTVTPPLLVRRVKQSIEVLTVDPCVPSETPAAASVTPTDTPTPTDTATPSVTDTPTATKTGAVAPTLTP